MAETLPEAFGRQVAGFTALPVQRQLGLLVGAALVIALTATIAMWGLQPTYQMLLPGMSERDRAQALTVLSREGIAYRLEPATGALMVPAGSVHEARLKLATEGIPRAGSVGYELLDEDRGLGASRLQETARHQRALEGELARSIMTLASVNAARVHLALPRQSVFVRDRVRPTASVLIDLHPGRSVDETQVAGIVHMVASSVPELEPDRVTILDQRGRLLSQPSGAVANAALPARQLDYTRRVEDDLRARIERILAPLLGENGMRAQVTAEIDFTEVERTEELYDGERPALRSQQLIEEQTSNNVSGGIPGALTNQPPAAAAVQDMADATAGLDGQGNAAVAGNRTRRDTRNFELDRTINHVRMAPANLQRLSVAVVVDHREVIGADGTLQRIAREPAEIEYLRSLVEEAVGYNEARGDRVNLVNASFHELQAPEPLPEPALWEQVWVRDLIKQGLAGLGVLLLILLVLRPMMKTLAQAPRALPQAAVPANLPKGALAAPAGATAGMPAVALASGQPVALEESLSQARSTAKGDPKIVAQVVRQWMVADEK